MKQRKVWTKVWKDEWFCSLSQNARLLFLYLITNESIGFTGCYELSDRQISFDTKLTGLDKLKTELFPKIKFLNGWVYVVNCQGYNGFVGESFEVAIDKERITIPQNIKDTLIEGEVYPTPPVTLPSGGGYSSNTNSNNKYNKIEDCKEEDFETIANKYQVPVAFVKSKYDDLVNWHEMKPQKNRYANYFRALSNWVKRDSLKIKTDYAKQNSDLAL